MKSLIITGIYRSGTTLIQKLLDANPQMAVMNHGMAGFFQMMKPALFEQAEISDANAPLGFHQLEQTQKLNGLFENTEFDSKKIDQLLQRVENEMREDNTRAGNISHPTSDWLSVLQNPTRDWLSVLQNKLEQGTARQVLEQQFSLIAEYKKADAVSLIGFKELHLEQYVHAMLADNPDLKVIQITRDPRAVLASRNFSKAFLETRGAGAKHPIRLISQVWSTSIQYKRILGEKFPNTFMSIKYETLVSTPETATRHMCDFLGVDWDPVMLDVSSFRSELGKAWEPNSSFEKLQGFDSKAIDNWRSRLPSQEHAVMEYLCGDLLEQEGYERNFDSEQQQAMFSTYTEALEELAPWSRQPLLQIHP
jgi:hypothetical protein